MLIISHDRYFINKLADRIIEITPDGVKEYLGNYDYYLEKTLSDTQSARLTVSDKEEVLKPKVNDYKLRKEEQARERKRKNDLNRTEERIEAVEVKISELEVELQSEEVTSDYEKLISLSGELEKLQQEQAELYSIWEELAE